MKIKEISAHCSTSFNHPYEQYANYKPGVSLVASIEEGDDVDACIRDLQDKAQTMVDLDKASILAELQDQHRIDRTRELLAELDTVEAQTKATIKGIVSRIEGTKAALAEAKNSTENFDPQRFEDALKRLNERLASEERDLRTYALRRAHLEAGGTPDDYYGIHAPEETEQEDCPV